MVLFRGWGFASRLDGEFGWVGRGEVRPFDEVFREDEAVMFQRGNFECIAKDVRNTYNTWIGTMK